MRHVLIFILLSFLSTRCKVQEHPIIKVVDSKTGENITNDCSAVLINLQALNLILMPEPGSPKELWAEYWYMGRDSLDNIVLGEFNDRIFKRKFKVHFEAVGFKTKTVKVSGECIVKLTKLDNE